MIAGSGMPGRPRPTLSQKIFIDTQSIFSLSKSEFLLS
jgi:hypothetical protein